MVFLPVHISFLTAAGYEKFDVWFHLLHSVKNVACGVLPDSFFPTFVSFTAHTSKRNTCYLVKDVLKKNAGVIRLK